MTCVVKQKIGKGVYGHVYETTDNRAFKRVVERTFSFPLISELEVFSRLKHPNVVAGEIIFPKLGASETPTKRGKETKFSGDKNVLIRLTKRDYGIKMPIAYGNGSGYISDPLVCFKQIVHAIAAFHWAGFLHLDLKLSNILVFGKDDYRLCDFSLSVHELVHYPDTPLITTDYRPLENLKSATIDYSRASDIWSLGVLGLRLLSGGKFFETDSSKDRDYLEALQNMDISEKIKLNLNGTDYENFIPLFIKILNRDNPNKRPSALEILADLGEQFVEPQVRSAQIPSLFTETPKHLEMALEHVLSLEIPQASIPELVKRIKCIAYVSNEVFDGSTGPNGSDVPVAISLIASHSIGIFQNMPDKIVPLMWDIIKYCDCIFDFN